MPEGEVALADAAVRRLGVAPGGADPVVEYRQWPMARWPIETGEGAIVEHGGDEALVLDDGDSRAIADGHASRLLAAVLQGEEAEERQVGDRLPGCVHTEDAARLLGGVVGEVVEQLAGGHGTQSARSGVTNRYFEGGATT